MRLRWQPVLLFALGLGLGAMGQRRADAGGTCPDEDQCSIKKPNFMVVLDYSSAMNEPFDASTRWDAAVDAVQGLIASQNGYFDDTMHFGLVRFGHDPDPAVAGTTIPGDSTGLVDGTVLDLHWYDPGAAPDFPYFECNGQALVDLLETMPAPPCTGDSCTDIGSWSFGGLQHARAAAEQTKADHPADLDPQDERYYANLLVTHGMWTEQDGVGMDAAHDPALAAADAYADLDIPTFVVTFDDPMGTANADAIAIAGNTGSAYDASDLQQLYDALQMVMQAIIDSVFVPECTAGLPRIMVILDASSAMLNTGGVAGAMGTTPWDQARAAIAGQGGNALFDTLVMLDGYGAALEDLVHIGLLVFGNADETAVLVQYDSCAQDAVAWALHPETSCAAGCADPWGGPPITWTFMEDPPELGGCCGYGGATPIRSHMPLCDADAAFPGACSGSGAYLHLGLALASSNQAAYAADPPVPADAQTKYINLLITSGAYDSTDAQVMAELTSMHAAGITTYVLGIGEIAQAPLDNLACWGSGGAGIPCAGGAIAAYDGGSQAALEQALADIVAGISFDSCCGLNDCSFNCECGTGEPDPIPPAESSSSTSTSGTMKGVGTSDSGGTSSGAASNDATSSDGSNGSTSSDASTSGEGGGWTNTASASTTSSTSTTGVGEDDGSSGIGEVASDATCACSNRSRGGLPLALFGALAVIRRRRRR